MSALEGLKAVIEKDEIVPTRRAQDFLERPKEVYDTYHFHVQTYIPIQIGADDSQAGVDSFAKRLITQVKNGRSPRGYIVGEFGYGKTSAGLYVWEQAIKANLIALPPFQLNKFTDFIDATAGWVGYQLGLVSPSHQTQAQEIYERYTRYNLEAAAQRYHSDLATLERMYADGLLNLAITGNRVLDFFREMTALVQDAGFAGLVLMADEIQQYLTPRINEGVPDPVGALFDIVQGLANERQDLNFGFLLIMPTFQLGTINDQRGDLIDRMRDLTLDLKTIYDRRFPSRLWERFSQILGFERIAHQVILPETLDSLGQIASRSDLSNGPRTVVNVLKLAAKRYVNAQDSIPPYSPIDLIEDFVKGDVQFDGTKKVQEAVTRALNHEFVRQDVAFTNAVKLAAAFPLDGATELIQAKFNLQDAVGELRASGLGDIVIEVGNRHQPGITLRGLDNVPVETDELTLRLREFARHYEASSALTIQRAKQGFVALLKSNIFQNTNWKLADENTSSLMFGTTEMLFTGAFPSMESRYPSRDIHIRVIQDGESPSASQLEAECSLIFYLNHDFSAEKQDDFGAISTNDEEFIAYFSVNLMLPTVEQLSRQLQDQLTKAFASNRINVLLLLALHTYLTELRQKGALSKPVTQIVESSLQRQIFEGVITVLFNPQLGAELDANGVRIIEQITTNLIKKRYGDHYYTLMTYQRWRDVIRNYIGALERLPRASQRRGLTPLEATKGEIADYFGLAVTGLDNMLSRIPHLIDIPHGSLSASKSQPFHFHLHPLEEQIWEELQHSGEVINDQGYDLHILRRDDVESGCIAIGYKSDEIEHIFKIMQARDLITLENGYLIEKPRPQVSLDEVRQETERFLVEASQLNAAMNQPDTHTLYQQAQQFEQRANALHEHDEDDILRLSEDLVSVQPMLQATLVTAHQNLQKRVKSCLNSLPQPENVLSDAFVVPVVEVSYAPMLNDLRAQFEQAYQDIEISNAALHRQLDNLHQHRSLDIATLSDYIQELDVCERDADKIRKQWTNLNKAITALNIWNKIAEQQASVMADLQRLGGSSDGYLKELTTIDQQIYREFDQNPEIALQQTSNFQHKIDQLARAARQAQDNHKERFDRLQHAYRTSLAQNDGLLETELWDTIIFSPLDPDAIYQQLYERVHRSISTILDNIYNTYERYVLEIKSMADDPALSSLKQNMTQLQQDRDEINNMRAEAASMNTLNTVRDFDGQKGRFVDLMASIAKLRSQLVTLRGNIQQLHAITEKPQLSRNANQVHQTLAGIQHTAAKDVDLFRLRQSLSDFDDQTLWKALQELWQQRALEISIRLLED